MKKIIISNREIGIIEADERDKYLSESDKEMDARAEQAVKAAIEKAEFCKKPVARYDMTAHKSYIEYPDGRRQYAE
ncbi:MAG: hypothetical protein LUH47_06450 [Clostridiales bacterium]|nr:hypothetical protein [Clostridiales bacterium]